MRYLVPIIIVLVFVLFLLSISNANILNSFTQKTSESFDAYVGKMVPYLINSGRNFDEPNQFGEILDPYYKDQSKTERYLWDKIHRIQLETPL